MPTVVLSKITMHYIIIFDQVSVVLKASAMDSVFVPFTVEQVINKLLVLMQNH